MYIITNANVTTVLNLQEIDI